MHYHIKWQRRHQVKLVSNALDYFVTEDNPFRVVDVFVDGVQLDFLGLMQSQPDAPDINPQLC